ncbi:MAG: hypothetical protein LBQ16_07230 [Gracilibacteraceae bacterium]|jgi:hypothetical protein|nr:hypothetical protein [Gracilibacteraceae bacterium]
MGLLSMRGESAIILVVSFLLAVAAAITAYFVFLPERNAGKYSGFAQWAYEFLSFKKLIVLSVLKILYCFTAAFFTLYGILMLFFEPLQAILTLTIGNVLARVFYELTLVFFSIHENTTQILNKISAAPRPVVSIDKQPEESRGTDDK